MADYRYFRPKFWNDPYIKDQCRTVSEKELFVWLFTNEHSSQAGIYPISTKTISEETAIPQKRVQQLFEKFIKDKKIKYQDKVLWVINFLKHQPNKSSKVLIRIAEDLNQLNSHPLVEEFLRKYEYLEIPYRYPIDTLSGKEKEKEKNTKRKEDKEFLSNKIFIALKKYLDWVNHGKDMTRLAINTFKKYGEAEIKKALGKVERDYQPSIDRFWEVLRGNK